MTIKAVKEKIDQKVKSGAKNKQTSNGNDDRQPDEVRRSKITLRKSVKHVNNIHSQYEKEKKHKSYTTACLKLVHV